MSVLSINAFFTVTRTPEKKHHNQMQLNILTQDAHFGGRLYSSAKPTYSKPQKHGDKQIN